jgi:hypothetical protein
MIRLFAIIVKTLSTEFLGSLCDPTGVLWMAGTARNNFSLRTKERFQNFQKVSKLLRAEGWELRICRFGVGPKATKMMYFAVAGRHMSRSDRLRCAVGSVVRCLQGCHALQAACTSRNDSLLAMK